MTNEIIKIIEVIIATFNIVQLSCILLKNDNTENNMNENTLADKKKPKIIPDMFDILLFS